jgi:hypothetical protein
MSDYTTEHLEQAADVLMAPISALESGVKERLIELLLAGAKAMRERDELRERLGKLWAQLHPDCAGGLDCLGCPGCKGVIY